jgi:hypothetical protein
VNRIAQPQDRAALANVVRSKRLVINGDNCNGTMACCLISSPGAQDGQRKLKKRWRCDILIRPRDLADRMSGIPQPEIFTLPVDVARLKVREILNQFPQGGYMAVVENWRQLPDGRIEFTMRHLPAAD